MHQATLRSSTLTIRSYLAHNPYNFWICRDGKHPYYLFQPFQKIVCSIESFDDLILIAEYIMRAENNKKNVVKSFFITTILTHSALKSNKKSAIEFFITY